MLRSTRGSRPSRPPRPGLYLKLSNFFASIFWGLNAITVLLLVSPLVSVTLLPTLWGFALVFNYYRHSSRELQRLDATSRSPIQSLFSEVLDGGVPHLRAYAAGARYSASNANYVDENNRAILSFQSARRAPPPAAPFVLCVRTRAALCPQQKTTHARPAGVRPPRSLERARRGRLARRPTAGCRAAPSCSGPPSRAAWRSSCG